MVYCDPMQYVSRSQRACCKWPTKRPLPNKCLLFNKRPLYAAKIVLDTPRPYLVNAPSLIDAPYLNYSKILGISKIIQFIHFLAWLTGLCVFHLVQCQIKSKDGNTVTLSEDSDIDVGGSIDGLDVDAVDIPLFLNSLNIFAKFLFALVELVTVMGINAGPFSFKRFLFVNRPLRDS